MPKDEIEEAVIVETKTEATAAAEPSLQDRLKKATELCLFFE